MKNQLTTLILLLCLLVAGKLHAEDGKLLLTSYTPGFLNGTIESFLADIQQKTKVSISFSEASVETQQKVRIAGTEKNIGDVLKLILADQKVNIVERSDKILIVSKTAKKKSHQQEHTLNGYIKDAASKEVLIGAIIYIPAIQVGNVTNSYGFYSITLPDGDYTAISSYIGYKADTFQLHLHSDERNEILLQAANILTEVTVTKKEKDNAQDHIQLSLHDINSKPALLGENDVMRALQNIAGVQCATDGTSTVLVRGGDAGHNLNLLDGVPVYYSDHFFGLTSVFNAEAIKSVNFYKGAFPSRYGGRLASVIDVNTKDGDMQKYGGQFTIGLVKSSLNLEGPIIKDKASFMISARRTWIDALWRTSTNDVKVDFYDINAKINYTVNNNNRIYLSIYNGRDQLAIKSSENFAVDGTKGNMQLRWGNTFGSTKWTSIINPKLFINTIFTYSRFKYELKNTIDVIEQGTVNNGSSYTGTSIINDAALKVQLHWYPHPNHKVETGLQYSNSYFTPVSVKEDNAAEPVTTQQFGSNEVSLYAEDEIKLGKRWMIRPGLHCANWFNADYSYSSLQPRLYTSFTLAKNHILFASFSEMAQFLHLINNNTYGILPADFWLPSTQRLEPEEALVGTIGYTGSTKGNFDYTVEGYYKTIKNVTMYNVGKDIFDNSTYWENKMMQGKGWSYGAEFSMQKKWGPLTISSAYTLSWTWRQFELLNDGKAFPYKYDRRHNLKIALTYQRNEKFTATANWTYMSGEAITIPDQISGDLDNNLQVGSQTFVTSNSYTYNYASWNNYRLPSKHRLDIGLGFNKQKRWWVRTWSVGMFNVYGHRNVLYAELVDGVNPGEFKLQGMSILQYIPYVSYKIKF